MTENTYIQEINSAGHFIHQLHKMGYGVFLDDFDSGFSFLQALYPMIFDEMKFDRAFLKTNISQKEAHLLLQFKN